MFDVTKPLNKKNNIVVQSNRLVEAYYDTDLTATEHKILRYAAGKMRDSPDDFPSVNFTVREFLEAGGISGGGYYSRFEKIADELSRKRIKIQTEKSVGWFPWLSALIYEDGEVRLTFNSMLKEMLLDLDGQFTKYDYKYIGSMRSAYTIRLFELLKQYALLKRRRVRVDVLRNMLGTGEKYKLYGSFKQRVLQQAQKELAEKDGITFDFVEIREGRKVVSIEFLIHSPKENKIKVSNVKSETNVFVKESEYLLDGYNIKIPKETLENWSLYGIELLNEVLKEINGKDIRSYPAYIEKILSSKHEEIQNERDNIGTDNVGNAELITSFIRKYKTREVMPEFYLKTLFITHVENKISDESTIEQLWEDNKEHIMKKVALYLP